VKHALTLDWSRVLSPCCLAPCVITGIVVSSCLKKSELRAGSVVQARCVACGRHVQSVLEIEFCHDECFATIAHAPRLWLQDDLTLDWSRREVFVGVDHAEANYSWIIGPTPVEYICLVCRALRAPSDFERVLVCWPGLFGVACRSPQQLSKRKR
jgi:hypothetical protein